MQSHMNSEVYDKYKLAGKISAEARNFSTNLLKPGASFLDIAITVEIENNNYNEMINASSDALDAAINHLKAGTNLYEIGKTVEETITSYGYKPIENLTGHSMQRYVLHAGMSIPNVSDKMYTSKPK